MVDEDNKFIKAQFHSFYKNYQFYGNNLLNPEYSKALNFTNLMYDKYRDLYFEVLNDDNVLQEQVTSRLFKKVNNENDLVYKYLNKETGLYLFVIKSDLKQEIDLRAMINLVFNIKYAINVEKFFKYYEIINNKDDELINKSQELMLKKGIKFTKD